MSSFYICNTEGLVVRSGTCPQSFLSAQAQAGESIFEGVAQPGRHKRVGDALVEIPQPPPDYRELRRAAYPPIEDYVDAIVKDDAQQLAEYLKKCRAVKEKYPKEV